MDTETEGVGESGKGEENVSVKLGAEAGKSQVKNCMAAIIAFSW